MTDPQPATTPGPAPGAGGAFGHRAVVWIALACVAAIALVIAFSPEARTWDEIAYLWNLDRLRELGLGREFLLTMHCPAGPLHQVVHLLASPLTAGEPPGARLVSLAALVVTVGGTAWLLRRRGQPAPVAAAALLLAYPAVWTESGTALTTMPAMAFFALALALLVPSLAAPAHGTAARGALRDAIAGGLLMSLAILGRQPLLVTLAALVVFARRDATTRWRVAAAVAAGLVLPLPVFATWGGLTPIHGIHDSMRDELYPTNVLVGGAYAGAFIALVAPGWYAGRARVAAAFAAGGVALNLLLSIRDWLPAQTITLRVVPEALQPHVASVCGGAVLGFGALVLFELAHRAWQRRDDPAAVYLALSTLLLLGVCARMSNRFSSRYVIPVLPLLLVAVAPHVHRSPVWRCAALVFGAVLGLLSLLSHLGMF